MGGGGDKRGENRAASEATNTGRNRFDPDPKLL